MSDDNEEMFPDPEPILDQAAEDKIWGDKYIQDKEKFKYETIAFMAASGMSNQAIAKEIAMTQAWVCTILHTEHVRKRIKEIQQELWGDNIEQKFKRALPKAMNVMEESMDSDNERVRVDSAKWMLEKVTGKATQQVNVEGNLLGDLINQLDEVTEAREVDEVLQLEAEERDPMDEWVLNNVPTHSGVGKKDTGSSDE